MKTASDLNHGAFCAILPRFKQRRPWCIYPIHRGQNAHQTLQPQIPQLAAHLVVSRQDLKSITDYTLCLQQDGKE
jgi:hypothetical protein